MSYKIAIINGLDCHYECIGFLCETLLHNKYLKFQNIIINIYCNIDKFNYINYFKKIFPSINIYTTINSEEILKNDITICDTFENFWPVVLRRHLPVQKKFWKVSAIV